MNWGELKRLVEGRGVIDADRIETVHAQQLVSQEAPDVKITRRQSGVTVLAILPDRTDAPTRPMVTVERCPRPGCGEPIEATCQAIVLPMNGTLLIVDVDLEGADWRCRHGHGISGMREAVGDWPYALPPKDFDNALIDGPGTGLPGGDG